MRKIYSLFLAVFVSTVAYSQTVLYHENFEQPSGADSIASSGNPGWSINTTLAYDGVQSYHTFIAQQDTSYATTNQFSATGNNFVLFSFAHIAKISFFDVGIVEISFDSINWTQLTTTNTTYIGGPGSTFGPATQNKFTATTYPLWSPGNNTLIPDNSWWRVETFDISALAANMPQVWLRFKSYDLTGDGGLSNYGWLIDSITVIGYECDPALTSGTAASSRDSICNLSDVTLTLTNSHGNIQWLESFDNGVTWNPVTGPGSNSDTLQVNPAQSVQYAAITTLGTCVSDTSNILSIHVEQVVAPTTTGASRCGIGNLTLNASGNGVLSWYDSPTSTVPLATGASYTPYITATTTYYVSSLVGSNPNIFVETFENNGNNLPNGWTGTGLWHVTDACVVGTPPNPTRWAYYGVDGTCNFNSPANAAHSGNLTSPVINIPSAASDAELRFRFIYDGENGTPPGGFDNAEVLISENGGPFSSLLPITGGAPTNIWTLASASLGSYAGSNIQLRWTFNTIDGVANEGLGLQLDSIIIVGEGGCESPRTPVTATMTTADPVSISATSISLCEGDPTTLTASSTNTLYTYTWSPNVALSSTTGASVTATPLSPITYYVIGDDATCANIDSVFIDVGPAAIAGIASAPSDTVCTGNSINLSLSGQQGNIQWMTSQDGINWSPATGTGSNSATFEVTPLTDTYYQAILSSAGCPQDTTNEIFLTSLSPIAPTVVDATRCGYGSITVQASGNGTINWYPDLTSLLPLGVGNSFTDTIQTTTTYYAANIVGGNLAPPNITLGSGNIQNTGTSYPAPYGNWFWGARHQFLITAAELLNAGAVPNVEITSLAFNVIAPGGATLINFDIKIGHTNVNNLATWIPGLTTVFSVPSYSETTGWNIHTFNTPFVWNGVDNIVIETCFNNSSFTTNAVVEQSPTSFTSTIYSIADQPGVCSNNNLFINDLMQRPNIRFELTGGGCSSPRVPVTATVTPPPAMTLTTTADSLCFGDTAVFNVTSSNAGYNYSWSPNVGLSATTGSTVSATPGTTTEYFLIADDNICGNIDSITITVHPMTVAGIASGPDTVCAGISAFLNLTGHTGGIQWQSFDGSNWVDETGTGSDSSMYQVTPSQTTTYQAVVQNGVCPAFTTNTLTVIVINPANPTTTGDSRCGPGLVNLSANGVGNFYWYESPQGGSHINIGTSYSPSLNQTQTFYVETVIGGDFYTIGPINNGFGNQASASNSNYGMTFDVNTQSTLEKVHVYPWSTGVITVNLRLGTGPVLASVSDSVFAFTGKTEIQLGFALSPATGYRLELISNGVSLSRNTSGAGYPYSVPGGPLSITGYFNPNPASAATDYRYFYDWLVSTGCKSTRIPVTGEILGLPSAPVITQQGNTLVSSSPSNNQWYFDGVLIPGATSQTFIPDTTGPYYVVVDNGACQETSNTLFFIHVGIDDPEQISLVIYPNPNSGIFNIEFSLAEGKDAQVDIYNMIGEVIYTDRINKLSGKYSRQVDISSHSDGLYFLRIQTGESNYYQKLIMAK